jgi:hypothetical protein
MKRLTWEEMMTIFRQHFKRLLLLSLLLMSRKMRREAHIIVRQLLIKIKIR